MSGLSLMLDFYQGTSEFQAKSIQLLFLFVGHVSSLLFYFYIVFNVSFTCSMQSPGLDRTGILQISSIF